MPKTFIQPGLEEITQKFIENVKGAILHRAEVIDSQTIRIMYYLEEKLHAKLIDFVIKH